MGLVNILQIDPSNDAFKLDTYCINFPPSEFVVFLVTDQGRIRLFYYHKKVRHAKGCTKV